MKATKKKAKKAAAKSAKKLAAKPASETVIVFKKAAKEGDLPKQAEQILALVEKAKQIERAALFAKMKSVIKTKQPLERIWSHYRNRLVKEGYVTINAAN